MLGRMCGRDKGDPAGKKGKNTGKKQPKKVHTVFDNYGIQIKGEGRDPAPPLTRKKIPSEEGREKDW